MKILFCLYLTTFCINSFSQTFPFYEDTNMPCQLKEMEMRYGKHQVIQYEMYNGLLLKFYNTNRCDTFFYDLQSSPRTYGLTIFKSIANYTFVSHYNCNGHLSSKTSFLKDKKHGLLISYYKYGGEIFQINQYLNDIIQSPACTYYENGQIKSLAYYLDNDDLMDSIAYFDTNGVAEQCNVMIPNTHGSSHQYIFWPNGQIYEDKYSFLDGSYPYVRYFENGQIMEKGIKQAGAKNGKWIEYYENGKIRLKAHYGFTVYEIKQGSFKYYDENENLIRTEIYENDVLIKSIEHKK